MVDSFSRALDRVEEDGRVRVFLARFRLQRPATPLWRVSEMDCGGDPWAGPIDPLLPWMVGEWRSRDAGERAELLRRAGFYAPHERLFSVWALESRADNPDEVPFSESNYRYERHEWFRSLARLFCLLCGHERRIFILKSAYRASQGAISFLDALMEEEGKAKVAVFLEAGRARSWAGPAELDGWPSLMKRLDEDDCLLKAGFPSPQEPVDGEDAERAENPAPATMEALRLLFCAPDAIAVLEGLPEEGTEGWDIQRLILCECWATIGDFGRAGLLIEAVISRLKEPLHLLRALLLSCRICGWKRSEESALRALAQAWEQATLLDEPLAVLQCRIHEVFIQEMFGSKPGLIELADALSAELRGKGLHNLIGYLDTLVIHYDWLVRKKGWDAAFKKANDTLAQYERLGNRYRQSILLHILGYLCAQTGRNDLALSFFRKGLSLRRKLGDLSELIKLSNGTGYFCFTIGRLQDALALYSKALLLMESVGEHLETCLTLFNMAQVYFFTGCFRESSQVLSTILEVMEILDYESLPFHRKGKILALAGLSAWHLGKESQAVDCLHAISDGLVDDDALPFVRLLQAVFQDPSPARRVADAFEDCLSLSRSDALSHLRLHALCCRWIVRGNGKGGKDDVRTALDEARDRGFDLEAAWMEDLRGGTRLRTPARLRINASARLLMSRIGSSARQEAMNLKLLNALERIQFLQRFQSAIHVGLGRQDIFARSLELIAEQIHPVRPRLRELSKPLAEMTDFVVTESIGEEAIRLELDARDSVKRRLDPGEVHVLSLALSHLELILDLKGAQEVLEEAARIDPLTGLFNRREILVRLELEHERCSRYAKDEITGFSILFIDLDRFKAYNDRFGHGAGDWVLKHFAEELRDQMRGIDVVGRWGGDEFLVLLPDTGREGARLSAERIIHSLNQKRGYQRELSVALGEEVSLKKEELLGCSIGISSFQPGSGLSVKALLDEADAKLYSGKQHGRGRVVV